MSNEVPKSPSEMPDDIWNCGNSYRNPFVADLLEFDSVEINYERFDDCDCDDEPRGEWVVEVEKGHRRHVARYECFINALWFVLEHAKAADLKEYDEWKSKKATAISKLTPEERRLLGIRG